MIDAAKQEKPETLKLIVLGEEGNGFDLALFGSDFGAIVKPNLAFSELCDTIQGFADYLGKNGIVLSSNYVSLNALSVLANAHRDKECQEIVNTWPRKKRKQIKQKLLQVQRKWFKGNTGASDSL